MTASPGPVDGSDRAAGSGTAGILAYGCYLPRLRLERSAITRAHAGTGAAVPRKASGYRSICNWDEDAITMAVESARQCLAANTDDQAVPPQNLVLASNSLPFRHRQGSVLALEALGLAESTRCLDVGGNDCAGTTQLLDALGRSAAEDERRLLIAAEQPPAAAGSPAEVRGTDGAAAILTGSGPAIARAVGHASSTIDFVDRYRGSSGRFDYEWEERWVRDEGITRIVPPLVQSVLEQSGITIDAIDRFVFASPVPGAGRRLKKTIGLTCPPADRSADLGYAGIAAPLLGLCDALDTAGAGEHILLVAFSQGADVLLLKTTDRILDHPGRGGYRRQQDRGHTSSDYVQFLNFTRRIQTDFGKRAEMDHQTPLSAYYRNRGFLNSLIGGRCSSCGAVQLPKSRYCVNPDCVKLDTQVDEPMAQKRASVVTWTADRLAFSMNPPACYGMVRFDGGGCLMMDFADVSPDAIRTGLRVRMSFRIRDFDESRGFRRYFWKAVPDEGRT